jgi:Rod binding domain-containing protein
MRVDFSGLQAQGNNHRGKAATAAQEFEGVLLSSLLSELESSFQLPGAESEDSVGDSIRGLGIQQLGEVWANRGGIGIGRMILAQIEPEESARKPL